MNVFVSGIGAYLPPGEISNETLAAMTGVDARQIQEKTGITRRRLSRKGIRTVHMAAVAGREALLHSGIEPRAVGLVVVVSSHHARFPNSASASAVKQKLGLHHAVALDVCTPYTGFLAALGLAATAMDSAKLESALIIGAEGFSRATRLRDGRTRFLFSDAAGALALTRGSGFMRIERLVDGWVGEACANPTDAGPRAVLCNDRIRQAVLNDALEAVRGPDAPSSTLHLVGQRLVLGSSAHSEDRIRPMDPFAETGFLLAAEVPLCLAELLRSNQSQVGDGVLVVSSGGTADWQGCLLRQESTVTPVEEVLATGTSALLRGRPRSPDAPADAGISVCKSDEMEERLMQEAAQAAASGVNLVAVVLKGNFYNKELPGKDMLRLLAEARKLVLSQVRATDTLCQLDRHMSFVVLLQYIDSDDSSRLALRLCAMLERFDPAGELELSVDATVTPLAPTPDPAVAVQQVLEHLGAASD
jgi:3-oxoacyl-[acyl-carrier-protein] synthase-3